jgi:hypothetical protein
MTRGFFGFALCLLLAGSPWPAGAAPIRIFTTGFEPAGGYDPQFTLVGQASWTGLGTGGNGLLSGSEGFPAGQQAFVGYFPPLTNELSTMVWRPLGIGPIPTNTPFVRFSVLMEIVDSTNAHYDCFRWSVFNTNEERLFTLDFDNLDLTVNYRLQNSSTFVPTGVTFSNNLPMQLEVTMDFSRNRWFALLDGTLLATNLAITTTNRPLSLGDIDAIWFYRNPAAVGNNFMIFDDYRITREDAPVAQPRLVNLGRQGNSYLLRVFGENGQRYAVEASTNFSAWTALRTNTADGGSFDFIDTAAGGFPRRSYRARFVP